MSGSFYGQFLGTVGVEIEGSIHRDVLNNLVYHPLHKIFGDGFSDIMVGTDASTQYYVFRTSTVRRQINISYHTLMGRKLYENGRNSDLKIAGYEIITTPVSVSELEPLMFHTTRLLKEAGDWLSDRTAVHFHVGFVNNLRLLKNLMKISLMVDPLLFRIGGMGRRNRGYINHFAYCRPLLHSTAVNVVTKDVFKKSQYAKIVNPKAALDAESIAGFWAALGVRYGMGGGSTKYWPTRYSGINFYAIPQHGTIEYRHFNKTLDTLSIMSIAKFVRGITELATLLSKKDEIAFDIVPSDVEISESDGSDILYRLYAMCQNADVEDLPTDVEMSCLLDLLRTSHMDAIPPIPVLTHLKENNTITMEQVVDGKLELVPQIIPAQFIDIHNIGLVSLFNSENCSVTQYDENIPQEPSHDFEEEEEEHHEEEDDF
jgi:hypothetical protein